ncbi:hypothetical protein RRF57_006617 [Xylaria bambusicola]|uniref:Uncharacterized protein n=1 Tax=Xylaria bambusicola TaxID=326684 RepID=A0AAN7Z5P9_9PEZI
MSSFAIETNKLDLIRNFRASAAPNPFSFYHPFIDQSAFLTDEIAIVATMGSQLVQAQWSLNQTSDSVYSIARGVLEAATSDNVQPLAIMACEQFGNTLAISRETRLRIERTVLPTPEPVTIQFLKAKVGFKKHDCAVQLGINQAGLRFLALAAALISSASNVYCANALMLMLEETTSDKRLLPTRRHLLDLMSSLDARCRLSGFSDVVFGYNRMIIGASSLKGIGATNRHITSQMRKDWQLL